MKWSWKRLDKILCSTILTICPRSAKPTICIRNNDNLQGRLSSCSRIITLGDPFFVQTHSEITTIDSQRIHGNTKRKKTTKMWQRRYNQAIFRTRPPWPSHKILNPHPTKSTSLHGRLEQAYEIARENVLPFNFSGIIQ